MKKARITVTGNIGKDLETKEFNGQNGSFTKRESAIGVSNDYKEGNNWINNTVWYELDFPDHLIQVAETLIKKGNLMNVSGVPDERIYTDNNGNPQIARKIYVRDFDIIRWVKNDNQVQQPVNQVQQPVNQVQQPVNQVQQPVNQVQQPVNQVQQPVNQVQQPVNQVQQPVNQVQQQNYQQQVVQNPHMNSGQQSIQNPQFANQGEATDDLPF